MSEDKCIHTSVLSITGNIMTWEGEAIQLSNITSISRLSLPLVSFPRWILLMLAAGIVVLENYRTIAFVCFVLAGVILLRWYLRNRRIKKAEELRILTNAGVTFSFFFSDKMFLRKVVRVLSAVIAEGGMEGKSVKIHLNNCTISGNAKVLNDMVV